MQGEKRKTAEECAYSSVPSPGGKGIIHNISLEVLYFFPPPCKGKKGKEELMNLIFEAQEKRLFLAAQKRGRKGFFWVGSQAAASAQPSYSLSFSGNQTAMHKEEEQVSGIIKSLTIPVFL